MTANTNSNRVRLGQRMNNGELFAIKIIEQGRSKDQFDIVREVSGTANESD